MHALYIEGIAVKAHMHKASVLQELWWNMSGPFFPLYVKWSQRYIWMFTRYSSMVCNTPLLRKTVAFNILLLLEVLTLVSLARLSYGTERESGLLPYVDRCLTPQEFIGAWTGSDDVCGCDVQVWLYNNKFFRRCALINREVCVALHMIYLSCTCQLNNYYSSVIRRHVYKHRQNQFMPQESLEDVMHWSIYGSKPDSLSAPCESLASETMLTCHGDLAASFVVLSAEDGHVHAYSFFKCVLLLHGRSRWNFILRKYMYDGG